MTAVRFDNVSIVFGKDPGRALDKGQLGELGTSHLVARQELRQLVAGLNLPVPVKPESELALIGSGA